MVTARQLHSDFGVIVCLSGLAGVAAATGRAVRGTVLLGASVALEHMLGYPVRAFEREDSAIDEAALAAQLDARELAALRQEGARLGWDGAVAFALTDDDRPSAHTSEWMGTVIAWPSPSRPSIVSTPVQGAAPASHE